MTNISVGEDIRVRYTAVNKRVYVLRTYHEVQYVVDVEENHGCMREDNPWFLTIIYSQTGAENQGQRYNNKVKM